MIKKDKFGFMKICIACTVGIILGGCMTTNDSKSRNNISTVASADEEEQTYLRELGKNTKVPIIGAGNRTSIVIYHDDMKNNTIYVAQDDDGITISAVADHN